MVLPTGVCALRAAAIHAPPNPPACTLSHTDTYPPTHADGASESSPSSLAYGGTLHSKGTLHSTSPTTSTPTHSTHTAVPALLAASSPLQPLGGTEDGATLRGLQPALQLQQLQQLQQQLQQQQLQLAPLTVPPALVPAQGSVMQAEQAHGAGALSPVLTPSHASGLGLLPNGGERPSSSKFRLDMMTARSSTHPMDRCAWGREQTVCVGTFLVGPTLVTMPVADLSLRHAG